MIIQKKKTFFANTDVFNLVVITYVSLCFHVAAVYCPFLVAPSNGVISPGNLFYQTTRTFSCNVGYSLSGSSNRTCQSDGSWSGTTAICTGTVILQNFGVVLFSVILVVNGFTEIKKTPKWEKYIEWSRQHSRTPKFKLNRTLHDRSLPKFSRTKNF